MVIYRAAGPPRRSLIGAALHKPERCLGQAVCLWVEAKCFKAPASSCSLNCLLYPCWTLYPCWKLYPCWTLSRKPRSSLSVNSSYAQDSKHTHTHSHCTHTPVILRCRRKWLHNLRSPAGDNRAPPACAAGSRHTHTHTHEHAHTHTLIWWLSNVVHFDMFGCSGTSVQIER